MRVLLTGASGFVGNVVARRLAAAGHQVIACVRRAPDDHAGPLRWCAIPDLAGPIDWTPHLAGVDVVAHLAGVAHVLDRSDTGMEARYRAVNTDATLGLAAAAAGAGVGRFLFMSSVRVYGDADRGRPFTAEDSCAPVDAYGRSKLEAERGLATIARETGIETVVLRPPLVYGPGVRANFLRMIEWIDAGRPLPFGAIRNRRSLVGVENLAAAVDCLLAHPQAAGRTFLPSDGEDVSTPELMRRIAAALGRPARLVPIPGALMRLGLAALGRGADYRRLFGSLAVDSAPLRVGLGCRTVASLDQGLQATVAWYRASRAR